VILWCILSVGVIEIPNIEKLGVVFHAEVNRSGRRTYINLPDPEVNTCRIEPGDMLLLRLVEIQRQAGRKRERET